MIRTPWSTAVLAVALAACSNNECRLDDPSSCPADRVCEPVAGKDKPQCFAPVQVQGRVFDLQSEAAISGAQVSAVDVNGAPIGGVARSDADGGFTLRVPVSRTTTDGAFTGQTLTLRAQARDFQPFPGGLRVALPLDTAAAVQSSQGQPWIVTGDPATIGLFPVAPAQQGLASISGAVASPPGGGVLVVAEQSGSEPNLSTVADGTGAFTLFNVPAGSYSLHAYSQGANYTPTPVTVAAADLTGVSIGQSTTPTATITGSVTIVATTGQTSVILVPASTFNPGLGRGESVVGLRAPPPGTAPNVTGAFTIAGVPDGRYAVLAAFENDGLVRDPSNIGGTSTQFVDVTNGAASALGTFKVTDAVTIVGPGANGIEPAPAVPTFTWVKYPSAADYDVQVVDALGNSQWTTNVVATGGGNASVAYAGPALTSGKLYQWRVTANKTGGPLSRSEDLRGVFEVQ